MSNKNNSCLSFSALCFALACWHWKGPGQFHCGFAASWSTLAVCPYSELKRDKDFEMQRNRRLLYYYFLSFFLFKKSLYFFNDFIYLFLERGGREGEKGGENYQRVVASCALHTGDLARNPGMCPDWDLNWWSSGSQPTLNPLSYTSQGMYYYLVNKVVLFLLYPDNGRLAFHCLRKFRGGRIAFPPIFTSWWLLGIVNLEHRRNKMQTKIKRPKNIPRGCLVTMC